MKRRLGISMALLGLLLLLSRGRWDSWTTEGGFSESGSVTARNDPEDLCLRVVNHVSGKPLAEARVFLRAAGHESSTAVSGRDGLVHLFLPEGSVGPTLLHIECAGHNTIHWHCRPSWLHSRAPAKVRMVARDSFRTIRVQVMSSVAERVLVHWNWFLPGPDLAPGGESGRLEIDVTASGKVVPIRGIPEAAVLVLTLSGQTTGWGARIRRRVDQNTILEIPLEGVPVTARVCDESGRARSGVEVAWVSPEELGEAPAFRDVSDELGRVELILPRWCVDGAAAAGRPLNVDLCDGQTVRPGVSLFVTGSRPANIVWRRDEISE